MKRGTWRETFWPGTNGKLPLLGKAWGRDAFGLRIRQLLTPNPSQAIGHVSSREGSRLPTGSLLLCLLMESSQLSLCHQKQEPCFISWFLPGSAKHSGVRMAVLPSAIDILEGSCRAWWCLPWKVPDGIVPPKGSGHRHLRCPKGQLGSAEAGRRGGSHTWALGRLLAQAGQVEKGRQRGWCCPQPTWPSRPSERPSGQTPARRGCFTAAQSRVFIPHVIISFFVTLESRKSLAVYLQRDFLEQNCSNNHCLNS